MATAGQHKIVIIGGGTAGITVAARLLKAGENDVAVIDPATTHYYQPLWTLVGGGCAHAAESARPQSTVMPAGVSWIQKRAEEVDPDRQLVTLDDGADIGYDYLVVCPGIQLNFEGVSGMGEALDAPAVSTNYLLDSAPTTWRNIQNTRGGTAVFTMPAGPIKTSPRRT